MLMSIFCGHVDQQIKYCLSCLNQIDIEIRKEGGLGSEALFFWLNSLLLHSSNLSLLFWPIKGKSNDRGRALRHAFDCPEGIGFFEDRKFRNHIAHMDERFEDWFEQSERRNIARQCIGPRGMISGMEANEVFEQYVPNEAVYIFRGDEMDLKQMSIHLQRIAPIADRLSSMTWWDKDFIAALDG